MKNALLITEILCWCNTSYTGVIFHITIILSSVYNMYNTRQEVKEILPIINIAVTDNVLANLPIILHAIWRFEGFVDCLPGLRPFYLK